MQGSVSEPIAMQGSRRPGWLMAGFWICVFIALAVAVRRIVELAHPGNPVNSPMASLNRTFSSHAVLTASHVIPAAVFVVLAVRMLLFAGGSEWWTRLFFLFGAVTGVTAYAMSAYAIGGWIERSAVLVFDSWFLYSLGRALLFYLQNNLSLEREWMTRAVVILLGIATTRPVMGVFFATSKVTGLTPEQFFGIAFWIGFGINAVTVELWLRSRRSRRQTFPLDNLGK